MPNSDFQDRLDRIRANSQQRASSQIAGRSGRTGARSINLRSAAAGIFIISVGFQLVKFVNAHYESIKESNGLGLAIGSGVAALGVVVLGLVVMYRSVGPKLSASCHDAPSPRSTDAEARRPSKLSRAVFSLFGTALGATASLYMYMGAAAKTVETETASTFANGALVIAVALALLSLLIGVVGLFVTRYPMLRVPVFFLLGGMLVFSGFRAFRIHPVDWPQFMALMQ